MMEGVNQQRQEEREKGGENADWCVGCLFTPVTGFLSDDSAD